MWTVEEALDYYRKQGAPKDQTALVSLFREIQQENGGGIPVYAVAAAAESYEVKESYLLAVIKRIPGLRLENSHCLELCAGPNCGKRAALGQFVTKTYGNQPKGFTVKFVPCMRMCGKGPNVKWDGTLYCGATEQLLRQLAEKKR